MRCFDFSNPEFDLTLVKNVLPLFIGTKDFRTFMGNCKLNNEYLLCKLLYNIKHS